MSEEKIAPPDFESIKQISPYGMEFWSARDLAPLLGYSEWRNFEVAVKRAVTSSEQVGQKSADHFVGVNKMVKLGSGAQREVKDYVLSRFACYLIAQNGDPRKLEIASAQTYFAVAARQNELRELKAEQDERLKLRLRVTENNKALAEAAYKAGVLTADFGKFQNAGYQGLYGGLNMDEIKTKKGVGDKENLLDRMGREELAANDFRITQTEAKLRNEGIVGKAKATETHTEVGKEVRSAIERIGGTMPEEVPAEPTIKPLIDQHQRRQKKNLSPKTDDGEQGKLF